MNKNIHPLCLLENIGLSFPLADRPILHDIHYQINQGDRVILLGGNGSGKSSLIKMLNRTYRPTVGEVYFQQQKISEISPQKFSQKVVTVTQDLRDSLFYHLTA